MKKIFAQAESLRKNKPLEFWTIVTKASFGILFLIATMFTFFAEEKLGTRVVFNLFHATLWPLYLILLLGLPIGVAYLEFSDKKDLSKKAFLGQAGFAALLFLIFILDWIVLAAKAPSYAEHPIGFGFFLDLILLGGYAILVFKEELVTNVLKKLFVKQPAAKPEEQPQVEASPE